MKPTHLMIVAAGAMSAALFAGSPEPAGGLSGLPNPWVIAHRGGQLLWPEETMEAFQASTDRGNHFIEADCWLLKDGAIGIMHDASLERTTGVKKYAPQLDAREWSKLRVDGRRLLGAGWGSYEVPTLDMLLARFGNRKVVFLEPKDGRCGAAIVEKLKQYRISKDFVVVNAFDANQLKPAIAAGYKTCYNLSDLTQPPAALVRAGYWAVLSPYPFSAETEKYLRAVRAAGIRVIGYTVNRHFERDRFLAAGLDGFLTDDPLYQGPIAGYLRTTDSFAEQRFSPGMLEAKKGDRGYFSQPDKWGLDTAQANVFKACLQGWMSPVGGKAAAPDWSMDFSVTFGPRFQDGRWASVAVLTSDVPLHDDGNRDAQATGYHILLHNTGGLTIWRFDGRPDKPLVMLGTLNGRPIREGETVPYRINVTPQTISVERLDTALKLGIPDSAYRGAYVTFGAKGQRAEFSKVRLGTKVSPAG